MSHRVLFIEAEARPGQPFTGQLFMADPELDVERVPDRRSLVSALARGDFDLVIIDQPIGWADGLDVVTAVKERKPSCPLIMLLEEGGEPLAVAAMERGLDDYVLKTSTHLARLPTAVRSALARADSERRAARLTTRMRGLLNRLNVGIFRATPAGRLLEVNPAFLRLLGLRSSQIDDGIYMRRLFVDSELHGQLFERVAGSHARQVQCEARLKRTDGSLVWVSLTLGLTIAQDDAPYLEGMIEDISQRRDVEAELAESESKNRALLDAMPDMMLLLDRQGKVLDVKAGPHQLPVPPAKLLGRTLDALGSPELISAFAVNTALARERRTTQVVELPLVVGRQERHFEWRFVATVQDATLVIARDVSEREQAKDELRRSHQELRQLASHLQSVREEERSRIAAQIHDELGQVLTVLKMDLAWLGRRFTPETPARQEMEAKIATTTRLIDSTLQQVKRIVTELRPRLLDDLGLTAALEWQTEEFRERTGIDTTLDLGDDVEQIEPEVATALFRIFQELMTNVIRHAAADRVAIRLGRVHGELQLEVRDNGRGIRNEEMINPRSFGLLETRERAHSCGGRMEITGRQGQGTVARVIVPMPSLH